MITYDYELAKKYISEGRSLEECSQLFGYHDSSGFSKKHKRMTEQHKLRLKEIARNNDESSIIDRSKISYNLQVGNDTNFAKLVTKSCLYSQFIVV